MMSIQEIIDRINEVNETKTKNISVSTVIAKHKSEFNALATAQDMYKKYYNKPGSKYYQMTPTQIVEAWDAKNKFGRELGMAMDKYIETYWLNSDEPEVRNMMLDICVNTDYKKFNPSLSNCAKGFDEFVKALEQTGWDLVCRETDIYYTTPSGITVMGRLDSLFMNKNGKLLLVDYKTNEEIKMKGFARMKGELGDHDECEYNTYTIQLYLYVAGLLYTYGVCEFKDICCCIVHFLRQTDPSTGRNFAMYPTSENLKFDIVLLNKVIDDAYKKYRIQG